MNSEQFNQLLSYQMLTALNTAGLFQQNQRMRPLTVEEIGQLQTDLLQAAQKLQQSLARGEQPPVPSVGQADT